jgi:hypothetical protein
MMRTTAMAPPPSTAPAMAEMTASRPSAPATTEPMITLRPLALSTSMTTGGPPVGGP